MAWPSRPCKHHNKPATLETHGTLEMQTHGLEQQMHLLSLHRTRTGQALLLPAFPAEDRAIQLQVTKCGHTKDLQAPKLTRHQTMNLVIMPLTQLLPPSRQHNRTNTIGKLTKQPRSPSAPISESQRGMCADLCGGKEKEKGKANPGSTSSQSSTMNNAKPSLATRAAKAKESPQPKAKADVGIRLAEMDKS